MILEAKTSSKSTRNFIQNLQIFTNFKKSFLASEFRAAIEHESISGLCGDASNSGGDRKRKKKSRWASSNDGNEKTFIPGMPTILPSNLNPDQQEAYLGNYQTSRRHPVSDYKPLTVNNYTIWWSQTFLCFHYLLLIILRHMSKAKLVEQKRKARKKTLRWSSWINQTKRNENKNVFSPFLKEPNSRKKESWNLVLINLMQLIFSSQFRKKQNF